MFRQGGAPNGVVDANVVYGRALLELDHVAGSAGDTRWVGDDDRIETAVAVGQDLDKVEPPAVSPCWASGLADILGQPPGLDTASRVEHVVVDASDYATPADRGDTRTVLVRDPGRVLPAALVRTPVERNPHP